MAFLDPDHPMFRRAWVRWATAIVPLAWAVLEFAQGGPFWGILFGAAGIYAFYVLILNRKGGGTGGTDGKEG
ncbi:MAG: hypothetical protein N2422_07075 [Rhodobacteraceae bacterium]|nr:hypothetical protein [Paracoccaceae bacterium]